MSRAVRIGVAQLRSTHCQESNHAVLRRLAAEAAAEGCKVLFLPENADFIAQGKEATLGLSAKLDDATLKPYADLAEAHNLWINIGGLHELAEPPTKIKNTQVLLDNRGRIVTTYTKVHLFDVDVPGGRRYQESSLTVPGATHGFAADTPVGRMGLTTCYDLRFPEQYHALRYEAGCDVLTVPSAFMVPTGRAHWEVLLRARAIDTQCFVVAAAQSGAHNDARSSYGHSLVVDPWGTVVLDMGAAEDALGVADLDYSVLEKTRLHLPLRDHQRQISWPQGVAPEVDGAPHEQERQGGQAAPEVI
eukprot:TRINITY_DN27424_c0_g1_i1.p2 TRINITY_DN27424_c0_g1~~TRINITY_DN27424_c0_g1_i1.p2  ORF type:complete len:304 (+),score=99.52 TRINITY_DN27424_c0_g1_i1:97-1008(+)